MQPYRAYLFTPLFNLLAQKWSGEVREGRNSCARWFSWKGRFVSFGCSPKLTNVPPCYVFLIQSIDGTCIFSSLLANFHPWPKTDKRTPPQTWGGLQEVLHIQFRVCVPCLCPLPHVRAALRLERNVCTIVMASLAHFTFPAVSYRLENTCPLHGAMIHSPNSLSKSSLKS